MLSLIFKILYTLTTFIQTLVVFRIILKIVNADGTNNLVSWVYSMSDNFIQPFKGIIAESITIDRFSIELTPVIALIFFGVLGFVFSELSKAFRQAD